MKHVLTAAMAVSLLCSAQAVQAQEGRSNRGAERSDEMRENRDERSEERRARRDRERADESAAEERTAREQAQREQAEREAMQRAERERAEKEKAEREAAKRATQEREAAQRAERERQGRQQADRNRERDRGDRDRDGQRADRDRDWDRDNDRDRDRDGRRAGNDRRDNDRDRPRWARGERVPDSWRQRRVNDWRGRGLRQPPRGHYWIHNDRGDYFLASGAGIVIDIRLSDDRDRGWRQRYGRMYSRDDDIYYSECRNQPDPAGVIVGALIGGLLCHEVAGRGDRTGATVAGVIVGGTMGAALTSHMNCEDRSYAYRTYYDGFNAGRPNARYSWSNPRNDHRGEFQVGRYYDDPEGFRCATYSQEVWIDGRPQEAEGNACRQPDGTWAIVN